MSFDGPKIIRQTGALGARVPSTDNIMGLVLGSPVAPSFGFGVVKKLISVEDLEALGVDAAWDSTNNALVYRHVKNFFRVNPSGTLYILVYDNVAKTMTAAIQTDQYLETLYNESEGEVKCIGITGKAGVVAELDTTTDLETDAINAVTQAQAEVDRLFGDKKYQDVVVIGARLEATVDYATLHDLRTESARNVAVCVAQDPAVKDLDATNYANYSDVGTVVGSIGIRKVSENLGSVDIANKPEAKLTDENYSLTDKATSSWLSANLSNGVAVRSISTANQKVLTDKGYIFAGSYEGYPGIYFNDSPTCISVSDDFAWIERNRVWNKAARIVRKVLTPKMKSEIDVDADSGRIAATTVASWEALVNKALDAMLVDDEISGKTFTIDPKQDVLATSIVETKLKIVPKGTARAIENYIGFDNPAS